MIPSRTVQNVAVPGFFYGTAWKEERTEALTAQALDAGFVAIDTANQRRHYHEAGVGAAVRHAIASSRVARSDLFLQTKFTYVAGQDHRLPYDPRAPVAEQVTQSFESSLEHLGTDHVDSYVLHGPSSGRGLTETDAEVWAAMERLHSAGKARLLGISNVSVAHLAALAGIATVQPAFVQNRCFARAGWDRDVRAFCNDRDIAYQGFSLLTANGRELGHPKVQAIARRTGRSVAQVAFRFAIQLGMIPLTGTSSRAHLEEDLAVGDFALDDEDVAALESIAG